MWIFCSILIINLIMSGKTPFVNSISSSDFNTPIHVYSVCLSVCLAVSFLLVHLTLLTVIEQMYGKFAHILLMPRENTLYTFFKFLNSKWPPCSHVGSDNRHDVTGISCYAKQCALVNVVDVESCLNNNVSDFYLQLVVISTQYLYSG